MGIEFLTDVPALIKKIRLKLNLTYADLAKLLEVSISCVSNWENKHRFPRPLYMKRIVELCKKNRISMK